MSDQRELAAHYLRAAKALKSAMELSLASVEPSEYANIGKFDSYRAFATKHNSLVNEYIGRGGKGAIGVGTFDIEKMKSPGALTWPQAKVSFDTVYTEVLMFVSSLEGIVGVQQQAALELRQFFAVNLRRAMLRMPECEKDVQDVVEMLLIGRGYLKGSDYDRETGRVKFSGKEFIPDFIIPTRSIAIEVKFINDPKRPRSVIDEMNADIPALKTKFQRILFIVYDLGFVRDEYEFRSGLEKSDGVDVCLVKH
jgi:hypothetical protein